MKMYDTPQAVEAYLDVELECDCGKTHYAPIRAVEIGSGAINSLPKYMQQFGYRRPYILCDQITYEVAGKKCCALLKDAGYAPDLRILKHLGFDEATLGEIVINKPDDCDLMIGCGTGSITDMLRYSSFKLGLPCFTVATGAPMDGFSASVGIMNVDNLKATMPAHNTELIIGDTDILATAPYRMTIAGFGDLIGKLNALSDWRLGAIVNGDHYCSKIYELVDWYVNDILSKTEKIRQRDPEAIGDIMNALLLTGASISLYGSSRPISGAEHHMSHYWEVLGDQRGKSYAMHGEQVAVGTVLALMLAEELCCAEVDFDAAREKARLYSPEAWKRDMERAYGSAAAAVIALEESTGRNAAEGRLRRIDIIERRWDDITAQLKSLYPSARLAALLKELGCPGAPKEIGVTEAVLKDTLLYSKETRARYTVCQLAWDLGMLDELSDQVIEKLKAKDML